MCWEQQQRDFRDRLLWQQMATSVPPGFHAHSATVHHTHVNDGNAAAAVVHGPIPRPPGPPQSGPGHPQIVVNAVGPNNQIGKSFLSLTKESLIDSLID